MFRLPAAHTASFFQLCIERSLTWRLLKDYCVRGRPVKIVSIAYLRMTLHTCSSIYRIDSKAVNVTLGVTLQSIENVDMSTQSLTAYYWLNLGWTDEYLTWDSHYMDVQVDLLVVS